MSNLPNTASKTVINMLHHNKMLYKRAQHCAPRPHVNGYARLRPRTQLREIARRQRQAAARA